MTELEFVNDWSELEAAVETLNKTTHQNAWQRDDNEHLGAIAVLLTYVPRLLTQYAKLVELSFALTEGWEQYATLQPPTGLYMPDHR
jgi:hypothetical protein